MNPRRAKTSRRRRNRSLLAERLESRWLLTGPFAPAAGQPGSTAVDYLDPAIEGWATAVVQYLPGSEVDAVYQQTAEAIGPAGVVATDTVSLGRGGSITLTFENPIRDGLGNDFAVFENGVTDTFLELAFVEVSSDGVNFFRFDNDSLTAAPVDAFEAVDPTNVRNLAGKYRVGFGTPFDLEELRGRSPLLDTTRVTHVRIVDVVGDGTVKDSSGRPIYDPFPTIGSAGFDLDGVAVIHSLDAGRDVIGFEDVGASLSSESAFFGPDPNGTSTIGPFGDLVTLGAFRSEELEFNNAFSNDYGSWTQWAYSSVTNNVSGGYTNQFGTIAGGGGNGTATFGVGFVDQGGDYALPSIRKPADDIRRFSSLLVTNTTYAAMSMRDGDSFAKQFGGPSGNDEDFFLLTITGQDDLGQPIGSVDVYLADYRFADNSLDYIVEDWIEVDLSSVSEARTLEFSISSSDIGPFGINTPAYFAVDEIQLRTPAIFLDVAEREVSESAGAAATIARVSRGDQDTSAAIQVNLSATDPTLVSLPERVTIPVGQPYYEFPIQTIDNDQVQGDRSVVISATADEILPDEKSLLVVDDDSLALSLSFQSDVVQEGGSVTAIVQRNDADLSMPVQVQLTSSEASMFSFNENITIPAGQASVVLTIVAVEDQVDRPDDTFSFTVRATGYAASSDAVDWLDNDRPQLILATEQNAYSENWARPTVDFEDLGRSLGHESHDNGSDLAGGFTSGGVEFNNDFDPAFGSWSGWAVSNKTDSTTAGYENQYSAIVGRGAAASDTYAVASAFGNPRLPAIGRDPGTTSGFQSIDITNTTYTALSMLQGDAFAKRFGGASGDDPDWLLLTIEGFDQSQQSIGSIEFYLADYRFADSRLDYIVDDWTEVSLLPLTKAVELQFSMSSSDTGDFGMNTPAFFAIDQLVMTGDQPVPSLTVSRNSFDVSSEQRVQLTSSDRTEVRVPAEIVIPSGSSSVTVPMEILHDRLVDGNQSVQILADSEGFDRGSRSLSVLDADVRSLSIGIKPEVVPESGGAVTGVIHRNLEDVSESFSLMISSDPADNLDLPNQVTIPAGMRSITVDWIAVDNAVRDGDRPVSVEVSAAGWESGNATIQIADDELSGIQVDPSGQSISMLELLGEDELLVRLVSQPLSNVVLHVESSGQDLTWEPEELTFTPGNWNEPQSVLLRGLPDLLVEGDELHAVHVQVDTAKSDPQYFDAPTATINVTVRDQNPTQLRIDEDSSHVFLVDQESGVELQRGRGADGIQVVANDEAQAIEVSLLETTGGPIEIQLLRGDDGATLYGTRFSSIDGGEGFDTLTLKLNHSVEFAALLNGRVSAFEQYVLDGEQGAEVLIASDNLAPLASQAGLLVLRVMPKQSVAFSDDAILVDPVMHENEFAQVVELGNVQAIVISSRPWQNIRDRWDVNSSGDVTALDALVIINELTKRAEPTLPSIESLDSFPGYYFDVSGDGLVSSLDALQVINEMARADLHGNGEWIPPHVNGTGLALQDVEDEVITSAQIPESKDKLVDVGNLFDQALSQIVDAISVVESNEVDQSSEDDLKSPPITLVAGEHS